MKKLIKVAVCGLAVATLAVPVMNAQDEKKTEGAKKERPERGQRGQRGGTAADREKAIAAAFAKADKDGDKKLSLEEFKAAMASMRGGRRGGGRGAAGGGGGGGGRGEGRTERPKRPAAE